jgi:DNA phosphorothioation-associated DGQHR protein 1
MNGDYPFSCPGLAVSQPFGQFFVTVIPARILLDVAFSDRLKAVRQGDGSYRLEGSQRGRSETRLKEIAQFISTPSAAFPNSIILAANYREEDGLVEEDTDAKWSFDLGSDGDTGTLHIPKPAKLAPIIDGQHRLFGYNFVAEPRRVAAGEPRRIDMPLLCSIYFDLPKPYQAFLFATINANQRPVNRSQTYELFGYNIEDESPEKWTPEKLAVFLSRKLNTEEDSPFHLHIVVAAENDFAPSMAEARRSGGWAVSTATVVEGIVRLISRNPKLDAYAMGGRLQYEGKDRSVLLGAHDLAFTPLRQLYRSKNDEIIYTGVKNYFTAVNNTFWKQANPKSYIRKTVGVQALFDVARPLFHETATEKDFRTIGFAKRLAPATHIDFSDSFFQASGTGRQRIRNCIELCLGLRALQDIKSDQADYRRLCHLE